METQLKLALTVVRDEVSIKYLHQESTSESTRENEVHIELFKLSSCPNEACIIRAIQKKISRTDIFKCQRHTLGICILLMLSKGYCVNSSVTKDLDNSFIERCWECIQVVSHNIPEDASAWIQNVMDGRSPSNFSIIYCQRKLGNANKKFLNSINTNESFFVLQHSEFNIPSLVWHRDDAIRQSIMLHLMSSK